MTKGAIGEADEFHESFLIGDDVQRIELKGSQMKAFVVCRLKKKFLSRVGEKIRYA